MAELFDEVALKPEEALEIKSPQVIEPSIERIASFGIDVFSGCASREG
jgi:hypothetical protein